MKGYRNWAAKIFGILFFISGIFKLMDPIGTSLIVTEYFKFFKTFSFIPTAWWGGFFLSLSETLLGAAIITGVRKKLCAFFSAAFMIVFSAITLLLWIKNPDMDCGCFGKVIHLTHAQSLIKNVILDMLWVIAFVPMSSLQAPPKDKIVAFGISAVGICLFALYFTNSNPAVDYASMYPGSELFRPNDFLSEEDPVLSFCTADGEYVDSLAYNGPVIVVSSYDPEKIRRKNWAKIRSLALDAEKQGFRFLMLMPEIPENLDPIIGMHSYLADRKSLMTLNRSNGGASYILSGMIVKKWEVRNLPDFYDLISLKEKDPTVLVMEGETGPALAVQAYILITLAIMFLL